MHKKICINKYVSVLIVVLAVAFLFILLSNKIGTTQLTTNSRAYDKDNYCSKNGKLGYPQLSQCNKKSQVNFGQVSVKSTAKANMKGMKKTATVYNCCELIIDFTCKPSGDDKSANYCGLSGICKPGFQRSDLGCATSGRCCMEPSDIVENSYCRENENKEDYCPRNIISSYAICKPGFHLDDSSNSKRCRNKITGGKLIPTYCCRVNK